MRSIGIRELKAQLSSIQRGDHILITDRGRVVAELRQPDASQWNATPAERARARMAAEGHLRIAEAAAPVYKRSPIKSRRGFAQELIDADREER